jgi:plasmid stabilization system protein ParE
VKPVSVEPEAQAEFLASVRWYAQRNPTVALRFFNLVQATLAEISEAPHLWPLVPNVDMTLEVRRFILPKFPYSIVFLELPTEVRVVAVAHARRKPGYWLERVPAR